MPLKKTPAKATAKAAPAKKAVAPKKRAVKEVEPEDEPEDEVEADEPSLPQGANAITVRISKSQTHRYENGCLDNTTAYADVLIDAEMGIEEIDAEMNRGRVLVALGLNAEFVVGDETVEIGVVKPSQATDGGRSGGSAKATASKPAAKKSGGGGRGGTTKEAHYTKEEVEAMWTDFADEDEDHSDDYFDNTGEGEKFPNIRPKDNSLEDIAERTGEADIAEKEGKPLYVKSAPKWVKDFYA